MPLMVWNETINSSITETCCMKFPENELIYIVQSNNQWRFLKLWVERKFCLFSSLSLTSKANQIQMYSKLKNMSLALYLDYDWSTMASSTFQCWIMEYRVASPATMMLNNYFILKIPMSKQKSGNILKYHLIFLRKHLFFEKCILNLFQYFWK
jgi:hypothetical protein